MNDADRMWLRDLLQDIKNDIRELRKDVEDLKKFRWVIYGKAAVIYSILVTVVEYVIHNILPNLGAS